MDDMTALERQIGEELRREIEPVPRFDTSAVVRSVVTTTPRGRWSVVTRLRGRASQAPTQRGFSMSAALRFMAASVTVALFGGFLLAGILTPHDGTEMDPGAASVAAPDRSAQPSVPAMGSITLEVDDLVGMGGLELFVKVFGQTSTEAHVPIEGRLAASGQMSVQPGEQFVWLLAGTPPCRDTGYGPECGDATSQPDYFCLLRFDVRPGEDTRVGLSGLPRYDDGAESRLACPVTSWTRSTEVAKPTTD
jgi:hypothetical protein